MAKTEMFGILAVVAVAALITILPLAVLTIQVVGVALQTKPRKENITGRTCLKT